MHLFPWDKFDNRTALILSFRSINSLSLPTYAAAGSRLSPARLAHPLVLLAAGCVRPAKQEQPVSVKPWNASGRRSANSPLDHPAVRAPFLEAGLEAGHVVDAVLCVGLEAALLATEAEFFVFELSLSDASVTS